MEIDEVQAAAAAVKIQAIARGRAERTSGASVARRKAKAEQTAKPPTTTTASALSADDAQLAAAATRIQGLARGNSVRKGNVLEVKKRQKQQEKDDAMKKEEVSKKQQRQEKEELAKAAVEIQRHFRGFQLRNTMSQKDREVSKLNFRERHEGVSHVKAEELHKTLSQIDTEKRVEEADRALAKKASALKEEHESDEWAAKKIQSMYRGFSCRKEQSQHSRMRDKTEKEFRENRQAAAKIEEAKTAKLMISDKHTAESTAANATVRHILHQPTPVSASSHFAGSPLTKPNINNNASASTRIDHLMPGGERPSLLSTRQSITAMNRDRNRLDEEDVKGLRYEKDPLVPDAMQVRAMEAIKLATKSWSRKYVMHIEPAAGSSSEDEVLRFLSMWSTPVAYRPVPRTIVHVHFNVTRDSLLTFSPVISFRIENQVLERTIGATRGISLQESWLDRVIMDKEKLRASFKMAA